MSTLKEFYRNEIVPKLVEEFGYKNVMEVPKITKVTINMGVGEAAQDRKAIEGALADMTAISGQKPIVNNARKSVAGFKIRDGWLSRRSLSAVVMSLSSISILSSFSHTTPPEW